MSRRIRDEQEHPQERFTWRDAEAPDPRDLERMAILFDRTNEKSAPCIMYLDLMLKVIWLHDTASDTWCVTSLLQLG